MKPLKVSAFGIFILGLVLLYVLQHAAPVIRLGAASLGLLFIVKLAALVWQTDDGARFKSNWGLLAYLLTWPGVRVTGFQFRQPAPPPETGQRFFESWLTFLLGLGLLITSSLIGRGESVLFNYLALFSVMLIVHLGLVEVAADGWRLLGFQPPSLFDRPYFSKTLSEFWSRRWNQAFVDMNKLFILSPLKPLARGRLSAGLLLFSIFAVSGIFHELAISYADGVSWGLPLSYFLIQGAGVLLERRRPLNRWLVAMWILLPFPLLFTPAFTQVFMGSLCQYIFEFLSSFAHQEVIKYGLLTGGLLHLLVLVASLQVPSRLNWREEFERLQPMNRKIVWTYGGYILSIIIFMSGVSFYLAFAPGIAGAGLIWIVFIALFWWARILIDLFYMTHADWPPGALFKIGHICLSTLFISMTLMYSLIAGSVAMGALK